MCKDCKKEPYYITTAIAYTSGKTALVIRMRQCWRMHCPV